MLNPEPRWSPAHVEAKRDLAALLLLAHRRQPDELGLLLAQVEREGRLIELLRHALDEVLHVELMICAGDRSTLDGVLRSDVATWAKEAS